MDRAFREKAHGQASESTRLSSSGRSSRNTCAGESPSWRIARRHGLSRNLIKIWVAKYEAGALDNDLAAADILAEYEARIAALERLVGRLTLENDFLKGASRQANFDCREAPAKFA